MYTEYIVPALLLVVGTVLSAFGLSLIVNTRRFLLTALRTQGRVVGYEERKGRGDGPGLRTYLHPKLEYEDQHGQKQYVTIALGRDRKAIPKGSVVPIIFDPNCPQDARIDSFSELWAFPLRFFLLGITVICMLLGIWFFQSRY
jgi:hypothetical protein